MTCQKCQTPLTPEEPGTLCAYCEAEIRHQLRRQHSALFKDSAFLSIYHTDATVQSMIQHGEPLEKILIALATEKAALLQRLLEIHSEGLPPIVIIPRTAISEAIQPG